jgi:uncharacterized protein YkwD
MRRACSIVAMFSVAACGAEPTLLREDEDALGTRIALDPGATIVLSASQGVEMQFSLEVPADARALAFRTSGGIGDADVYVRFGSPPTLTEWDHRPYTAANDETVTPADATAGTWFVMVRAYRAFEGVALVATYSAPTPDAIARALEDRVLVLVNERRAAGAMCGASWLAPAPPLSIDETIRTAARLHSADMGAQSYFSHQSADGRTFDARMREAGYDGPFPWGENIAAGNATAEATVEQWMNSPHHCENVMAPGFRVLGVGYAFEPASTYRHYWTQDFGGG